MSAEAHARGAGVRSAAPSRPGVAAGVLIVAVGLSVRFPITSVSPLLEDIATAYRLAPSGISALSAIPVLLFGVASPLAPLLVRWFGLSHTISALLAALALATLLRPLGPGLLFSGTVVVGGAIALLGILAPQIVRQNLAVRAGFWTGMYTTSFGVSAALGAALTVPLVHALDERTALALGAWAVPLLIAVGLALSLGGKLESGSRPADGASPEGDLRSETSVPASLAQRQPLFRSRGLWPVTGFFACQALIYFSLTAWLPTIAISRGIEPASAGLLLALMSVAGLPASLLAPSLAARERLRVPLLVTTALLAFAGVLALAFAPVALLPLAVAITGVASSAAFGLSIALIVFTTPSIEQTAGYSAVSQGIGYAIAASGPLLAGVLVDHGAAWAHVLVALSCVALAELGFGVASARAARARMRTLPELVAR